MICFAGCAGAFCTGVNIWRAAPEVKFGDGNGAATGVCEGITDLCGRIIGMDGVALLLITIMGKIAGWIISADGCDTDIIDSETGGDNSTAALSFAIADAILNKPGRLSEAEFEIMKTHTTLGYDMLKHSHRPLLKTAAIVAYEHHEKYNGKGYPRNLRGTDIHIYGRITAFADVFDALGSRRCYKEAWDDEKIFNLFHAERGEHFDPMIVDIFFNNINDFLMIREEFKDQIC